MHMHISIWQGLDELTNDGDLLNPILMMGTFKDYLVLRRVCGGTEA